MSSKLFEPLAVGPISLSNRIAISPMCQYSANDGSTTDWHLQHLMQLAISGAGLIVVEATAVERRGRITHGCLGLYTDSNERDLKRVLDAAKAVAPANTRFAIQLSHAGRKASSHLPWQGGKSLAAHEDAWSTVSASALPYASDWQSPNELSKDEIASIERAFVQAAERAVRIGFDAIELHFAHGYLASQFLSPLSNTRSDEYGGSLENRMRFHVQISRAVKQILPSQIAFGARVGVTDWVEGGTAPEDSEVLVHALKQIGMHYVCVSSGGAVQARVPSSPGFLAPFAEQIRKQTGVVTRVSGLIASPEQADAIVTSGQADMVAIARAILDNPRWVWHAADRLGGKVDYPKPYERVQPSVWAAAKLARPSDFA